eukprot:7659335-Pyramimonas_sp.AAC.1
MRRACQSDSQSASQPASQSADVATGGQRAGDGRGGTLVGRTHVGQLSTLVSPCHAGRFPPPASLSQRGRPRRGGQTGSPRPGPDSRRRHNCTSRDFW